MQRILVICGAGASSTFLVHWMRRVAAERELAVAVAAASAELLPATLEDADVLLVGNHLRPSFTDLRAAAIAHDVRAVLLPALSFDAVGAMTALELALGESDVETKLEEAETTRG